MKWYSGNWKRWILFVGKVGQNYLKNWKFFVNTVYLWMKLKRWIEMWQLVYFEIGLVKQHFMNVKS